MIFNFNLIFYLILYLLMVVKPYSVYGLGHHSIRTSQKIK